MHPPQCRCGAAGVARLRGVPPQRPPRDDRASGAPGRAAGHPGATAARAATIEAGRAWVAAQLAELDGGRRPCRSRFADLVVGTKCGGSDGLSGITTNPGGRPCLRPPGRSGRDGDVRGDLRADRLRAAHGAAAPSRRELGAEIVAAVREGRRLLPRPRPRQLRRRQHQARAHRRSRRSRSAPMPRAAPGRSSACSSPATGRRGPAST